MKKKFLICGILLLSLTGCGEEKIKETVVLNENLNAEINSEVNLFSFINESNKVEILDEDKNIDTSKLGKQELTIKYRVDNEEQEYKFEINVVDTEPPKIEYEKTLSTTAGKKIDLLKNVSAKDNSNEEIEVKVTGDYDFNKSGEYSLKYVASDSSGNTKEEEFTLKVNAKKTSSSNSASSSNVSTNTSNSNNTSSSVNTNTNTNSSSNNTTNNSSTNTNTTTITNANKSYNYLGSKGTGVTYSDSYGSKCHISYVSNVKIRGYANNSVAAYFDLTMTLVSKEPSRENESVKCFFKFNLLNSSGIQRGATGIGSVTLNYVGETGTTSTSAWITPYADGWNETDFSLYVKGW